MKKNFTLIELMIVVIFLMLLFIISIPKVIDAKSTSFEKSAISNLRYVHLDNTTYRLDNPTFGTIADLKASGKVDLTKPKAGYTFTDLIIVPTADYFAVKAIPTAPGPLGNSV